jgi:membrane dipeptidase
MISRLGFIVVLIASLAAVQAQETHAQETQAQETHAQETQAQEKTSISPRRAQIHDSAIVIDTHADTPQRFLDEGFDIGSTDPNDIGHISLDKARAEIWARNSFPSGWIRRRTKGHFARHTFDLIDSVYEQAARHPDRMMMAFSPQ